MHGIAPPQSLIHRRIVACIFVLVAVALVVTTALSSPTQAVKARGDSSPHVPSGGGPGGGGSQVDDYPNPTLSVNCAAPQLTVALLVDRSDSVVRNGDVTTPDAFKDSIYFLLDSLYSRFVPQGQVNILVYAFGTKSVLQNDRDSNGSPITNISSPAQLAAMKQAVSRIHFRDGNTFVSDDDEFRTLSGDTPGYQRASNDPWDRARAYNAGSENYRGDYGNTNWHDAFLNVANETAQNHNNPNTGHKIDLAIMLTDGSPTASNAGNLSWTPGQYRGPNPSLYSRSDDLYRPLETNGSAWFAERVVNSLRAGILINAVAGGTPIPARNPVSVRGIMIQPNPDANTLQWVEHYSDQVFGEDYYKLTSDFNVELKNEITSLINEISNETGCFNNTSPVTAKITLDASKTTVAVQEGETDSIQFTIANPSQTLLKNVKLCFGVFDPTAWQCSGEVFNYNSLQSLNHVTMTRLYSIDFGASDSSQLVTAFGEADATSTQLGGASPRVYDQLTIEITPQRVPLPS